MSEPLNIITGWDRFGFVAKVDGSADQSTHCAGPREAAHQIARKQFGHPYFTLQMKTPRCHYIAVEKEEAAHA